MALANNTSYSLHFVLSMFVALHTPNTKNSDIATAAGATFSAMASGFISVQTVENMVSRLFMRRSTVSCHLYFESCLALRASWVSFGVSLMLSIFWECALRGPR